MRHCRPSKQRLWLGARRYLCSGGRRYTDADTHCNSIGNGHAATDANTQVGAIGKAASHASAAAIEFRGADFWC